MKGKSDFLTGALLGAFGMAAVGGGMYLFESNLASRDSAVLSADSGNASRLARLSFERKALGHYAMSGLTDFEYDNTRYVLDIKTTDRDRIFQSSCALGAFEVLGYDLDGKPNSFVEKPRVIQRLNESRCAP